MDAHAYNQAGQPMSLQAWSLAFQDNEARRIGLDKVGDVEVSTVWLGLDHNFTNVGPPLIFETMIFGGEHDEECWRWATRDQAIAGHKNIVDDLKSGREFDYDDP